MSLVTFFLLLPLPYLAFWLLWWLYARHYSDSFRLPGLADIHQAWEMSVTVSYGTAVKGAVTFSLIVYYATLILFLITGS